MRIIVFSGKGGSGISTAAAATASAAAAAGRRTLAFGLSPGLGTAFGEALSAEPREVAKNLHALEGQPGPDGPNEFRDWMEDVLDWRGMDTDLAEDLASLPGLSHVGRLLDLERQAEEGGFDLLVVDAASLSQFLELPPALDAAARWLDRLFAPRQQNVFEPFLRVFAGEYATAGDDVMERGRELLGRLAGLRDLLSNPEVSTVRVVARPEDSALADVMDAISGLSLFSHTVDAVVLNQMLPGAVTDPFFEDRRQWQASLTAELARTVDPIPLLMADLSPGSPRGPEALAAFAGVLYAETDPLQVFHAGATGSLEREGTRYVMTLRLPFARKEDISVEQIADSLSIQINWRRRLVPLAPELAYHEADSWSLDGDELRINFRD